MKFQNESTSPLNRGLKVKSGVKAGKADGDVPPCGMNHGLKVRTAVKAGAANRDDDPPLGANHGLKVRTAVEPAR